jgi:hypothetical protein
MKPCSSVALGLPQAPNLAEKNHLESLISSPTKDFLMFSFRL